LEPEVNEIVMMRTQPDSTNQIFFKRHVQRRRLKRAITAVNK